MQNIKPPDYKYCPFCANPIGTIVLEEKLFKHCEVCNWTYFPHVAAAANGLAIREGKVLLVKRARAPYKDTWMMPAGFVSFGEHPEETVVREFKEETGYEAKVIKLVDIIQVEDDPRSMGHFAFFYEIFVTGEMGIIDKEENSDINWFELSALPKIGWHTHIKILEKYGGIIAKQNVA